MSKTNKCATFPQDRVLSLKLFYYDDRTPPDYQPSLFHDATFEQHAYFDGEPSKYMVGNVTSVSISAVMNKNDIFIEDG